MKITRGDTKRLKFQRRKKDTLEPITTIPDKLYFTVKYSENDDNFIFQKTLDNDIKFNAEDSYYYFTIKPSDTDNLPYINLFYDLQVNDKGVKKTIATGSLNVTEEVTFVSNESEYNAELQDNSDLCAEEIVTIEETDVIMNTDYDSLENKPSINDVELVGNKSLEDLGINIPDVSNFITKDVDDLTNYTATEDLERDYAKKDEIPSTNEFITKSVDDLENYTTTTDLEQNYLQKKDLKEPFKELSGDSINVWDLEQGNYVTTEKAYIYLQTGSSIEFNPRTMIIVSDKEDGKKQYEIIDNTGKVYTGSVASDGTPEENGNYSLDISKTLTYDNDFEYEVKEDFNPAHKQYVDSEVGDCYYTLDKNINEENDKQTIVNINAKDGSYSQVLCVDNIDLEMPIPTVDVLSANKGRDLNQRLSVLETKDIEEDTRIGKLEKEPLQVIEIDSEMSEDDKSSHTYPDLELNEEQIKIVMNNNISVLKVHYDITDTSNGTETDTLVFYTTIDDEKVISGVNTIHTIKINAIRRNDEGILVYHGTMMGNGEQYYTKVTLNATWKE